MVFRADGAPLFAFFARDCAAAVVCLGNENLVLSIVASRPSPSLRRSRTHGACAPTRRAGDNVLPAAVMPPTSPRVSI